MGESACIGRRAKPLAEWLADLENASKAVRDSKGYKQRQVVEGRYGDRMVIEVYVPSAGQMS